LKNPFKLQEKPLLGRVKDILKGTSAPPGPGATSRIPPPGDWQSSVSHCPQGRPTRHHIPDGPQTLLPGELGTPVAPTSRPVGNGGSPLPPPWRMGFSPLTSPQYPPLWVTRDPLHPCPWGTGDPHPGSPTRAPSLRAQRATSPWTPHHSAAISYSTPHRWKRLSIILVSQ